MEIEKKPEASATIIRPSLNLRPFDYDADNLKYSVPLQNLHLIEGALLTLETNLEFVDALLCPLVRKTPSVVSFETKERLKIILNQFLDWNSLLQDHIKEIQKLEEKFNISSSIHPSDDKPDFKTAESKYKEFYFKNKNIIEPNGYLIHELAKRKKDFDNSCYCCECKTSYPFDEKTWEFHQTLQCKKQCLSRKRNSDILITSEDKELAKENEDINKDIVLDKNFKENYEKYNCFFGERVMSKEQYLKTWKPGSIWYLTPEQYDEVFEDKESDEEKEDKVNRLVKHGIDIFDKTDKDKQKEEYSKQYSD